jgi:malate dehydrogenase (oxaloacetate-decarboxylating)(NADP+)
VTADDLSLAYSPGVAAPCLEIEKNPDDAYKYTAKGNLVAVISNGSAVLGLGNIGALAGKPVMEGKGILFKRFADIDVFDIEVDTQDTDELVRVCELIAPTFGGINLEDIRAPECFEVEERLKESLDIPVFHDDQHGTAIISAAALLNGLEIQGKKIEDVKVVFSGAGAASISCAKLYKDLGVKAEHILMTDSRGVMYKGRGEGLNKYKDEFVADTSARTLEDALVGADVFVGLSQAGLVTKEMVKSMADKPMVFAMANPDPEITPPEVKEARSDAICATGRSDYANQVNNVLGFPFIFRGALDVRATKINEEMKQAATYALAELAKKGEAVPEAVKRAYPGEAFDFGPEYIIPKPFDPRVLLFVAPAVAQAAMETGVAHAPIDLREYESKLQQMLGEIASL